MRSVLPTVEEMIEETLASYDRWAAYCDVMYAAMGRKPGYYRSEVVSSYAQLIRELGARHVLDCACGTGDPLLGLAKELSGHGITLKGSDGSPRMLLKCKSNAVEIGIEIELRESRWG